MSDATPSPWRPRAIATLVVLATMLFLFAPLAAAVAEGEHAYFEWDVSEQYWPDLVYLCSALHEGELPLWNPYDRGGYPYYADPQAAPYHPLNLALCAFGDDPPLGFATARVVLGFLLSGLFALGWLRRVGFGWSGAVVGAVLVEGAPFLRHNWELNLTSALAWLPAMLWATEALVQEKRPRDGVVLALAFACCAWTGSPPALWLASSFTLLYGLARIVRELHETPSGHRGAALRALVLPSLAFAIVAAGFVAVVFVPGLELARHSVQQGRAFSDLASEGLSDLSPLISPKSGNHLYVGLFALTLAPLALTHRARGSLFALIAATLGILLAMGEHTPTFRLAFEHVPGVSLFRLPHRYEAWLGPCAALLVAGGLDALATRTLSTRRSLVLAGASLTIGSALAFVDFARFEHDLGPAMLAFAVATIAVALPRRRLSTAGVGALLACFVVIDVTQALPDERHLRVGPPPGTAEDAREVLAHAPGVAPPFVTHGAMDEFAIGLRAGTRFRFPELRGYQDPLTLASHERVLAALSETPALAAQFGVAYALQGPHYLHGWNRHFLPRTLDGERTSLSRERSVTRLPRALPIVYAVPLVASERVASRQEALARVRELAPAPIALLEAVEATPLEATPLEATPHGDVTLTATNALPATMQAAEHVELGRDHVRFAIDAPSAGYVVINQAWYPGWIAEVDGVRAPVLRANGFVRAVPIAAGNHRVELRFEPDDAWTRTWWLGTWLVVLGLAGLGLVGRVARRARR